MLSKGEACTSEYTIQDIESLLSLEFTVYLKLKRFKNAKDTESKTLMRILIKYSGNLSCMRSLSFLPEHVKTREEMKSTSTSVCIYSVQTAGVEMRDVFYVLFYVLLRVLTILKCWRPFENGYLRGLCPLGNFVKRLALDCKFGVNGHCFDHEFICH